MAQVPAPTRPLKQGNVRTYQAEVAAAFPADVPIVAAEVDADLDTIYATAGALCTEWNAGIGPEDLNAAAVTRAKIAADAWLSPVPAAGDVGKVLRVASGPALAWDFPPGGPPSGPAGGDLAGAYPNPTIGAGKVTPALTRAMAGSIINLNAQTLEVPGGWITLPTLRFDSGDGVAQPQSTVVQAPAFNCWCVIAFAGRLDAIPSGHVVVSIVQSDGSLVAEWSGTAGSGSSVWISQPWYAPASSHYHVEQVNTTGSARTLGAFALLQLVVLGRA